MYRLSLQWFKPILNGTCDGLYFSKMKPELKSLYCNKSY